MIIVYAGVQADAPGRTQPRLPPSAEERLAARVRGLLHSLRPGLVVGAAASGSDIIIAEAALLEGADVRLVLPFDLATFQQTSVQDQGGRWAARYRRLVHTVGLEKISQGSLSPDDQDAYRQHNEDLIKEALTAARQRGDRLRALVIRPVPDDDASAPSVSDDFAQRAESHGIPTLDLDPMGQAPPRFHRDVLPGAL